jgi:hypothetical protein
VVYPGGGNVTQIRAMGAELALAAIVVLLVAAGLSALLLRFGLGRQISAFEAIDGVIAGFERGAWRSAASAPATPTPSDDATGAAGELRRLLDAAETRYRATGQALASLRENDPGKGRQ